jgi:hypothetical protein
VTYSNSPSTGRTLLAYSETPEEHLRRRRS